MNKKQMTDKEIAILSMILEGISRREIAYKFDICESRISQIVSKNWNNLSEKDKSKFKSKTLKHMAEKSRWCTQNEQ